MFSSHIGMTADAAVKLNKFSYKARLPITQDVCWFNLNTELGFKSITPLKYCVPPKLLEISKNRYFVKYSCMQVNVIESSKRYDQRKINKKIKSNT